jgi:hypothetical protein
MEIYLFLSLVASMALNGYVLNLYFRQTRERDVRLMAKSLQESEYFIHREEEEKKIEKKEKEKKAELKKMTKEELEAEEKSKEF